MKKTKKLLSGIVSTAMITGLTACSDNSSRPPVPDDASCDDWEWDANDGVWECDDEDSQRYGHYFYGGSYYSSKKNLHASSAFKSYKSGSSIKGGSSGFGSGSKGGFGG